MEQFIVGVISGIVASFICWFAKTTYQYFRYYKNSKYRGTWINEIFDENNQVIKRDITTIKHNQRTNCITGRVKRDFPYEQRTKKWYCSGVITDNHIIVSFWANDLIKSDGCVYASFVSDYTYEGYYLKETENRICKVKIRLTKENKS